MANWDVLSSRGNVEDRRSSRLVGGVGGLGLVGTLVVLAFTYFSSGGDVTSVLRQLENMQGVVPQVQQGGLTQADDYPVFASKVLGSNNDVWQQVFSSNGGTYTLPRLVLFRQATQSACGEATSEVGPHYCSLDSTIYLDETFFDELQQRFKAKGGDVAEAYVISHEVGHHVQNQLGILDKLQRAENDQEGLSIKVELQADCLAGVWAHAVSAQGVFETGEVAEALDAAAAVGDDRIQQTVSGRVNPETWTHGSSEQRVHWFTVGFETGEPSQCSTVQ